MFGGKKESYEITPQSNSEIKTLIGEGCLFEGNLTLSDSTRVDGHVKGNVNSRGILVLGENGLVEGDISANEVVVYGKIFGNVTAKRVDIKRGSEVNGDLNTEVLIVEEGATYNGRCSMSEGATNTYDLDTSE